MNAEPDRPSARARSERIYRALTGETSVHLADWPDAASLPAETELVAQMDLTRDVCGSTLALREANRLRVRLPLRSLTIAHPEAGILDSFRDLIADEVNVKSVTLTADVTKFGTRELKVDPKLGAKIGGKVKEVFAAAKSGQWQEAADGRVDIAGITLEKQSRSSESPAGSG